MADEEQTQEPIEPTPPPPPAVICVVEDYDADNPDHYAQWVLSGKPNLSDQPPWQPYFLEDLQPDGETYVRRPQPQPPAENPVTDVERAAAALAARRRTREDVIFSDTAGLVATCYAWLQRECAVPGGGTDTKTASQALQAGQGLCSTQGYGLALRAWIDFAASDFYTALSSPDATRPWLEWVPAGEPKSIREAILDRVYLATYGVPRP